VEEEEEEEGEELSLNIPPITEVLYSCQYQSLTPVVSCSSSIASSPAVLFLLMILTCCAILTNDPHLLYYSY
jgi:hypothetical protein